MEVTKLVKNISKEIESYEKEL